MLKSNPLTANSLSPLTYAVFLSFRIYTVVGAIVPLSPVFNIVGAFALSFPTKILVGAFLVLNLFRYPDPILLSDKELCDIIFLCFHTTFNV